MYYTVDRIEGDNIDGGKIAILDPDGGEVINIKLQDLPLGVKEGDILKFENNVYTIDAERTKCSKKDIDERFKKLFLN